MLPIDKLKHDLEARLHEVEIDTSRADDPNGWHFLHLRTDGFEVSVQWKQAQGFGLSSFGDDLDDLSGLFEAPDEWYSHQDAAFHRIVSLVIDRKSTKLAGATLPSIRHDRGLSQEALSAQLNVRQGTYSKLERREDVKVSSLRKVVEAMGGKLLIQAIFPDTHEVREVIFR